MRYKSVLAVTAMILFLTSLAFAEDQWVRGYTRSDGTQAQGYHRSAPDGNPYNNYSYPGNTNPYTGKTAGGSEESYGRRSQSPYGGQSQPFGGRERAPGPYYGD